MNKREVAKLIHIFNQNRRVKDPKMTFSKLGKLLRPELTENSANATISRYLSGKRNKPEWVDEKIKAILTNGL